MEELKSIIEFVSGIGVIGVLIVLFCGMVFKKWLLVVPYWTYEKMEADRNEWRALALQNMSTTRHAVNVTEKVVDATLPITKSEGG